MTRILLLCEFATLNGGEHSMLSTLDHVRSAGIEIIAVAPRCGPLVEEFSKRNIEVRPIDFRDSQDSRRPLAELRESLSEIIRKTQPSLVHANSLSMGRLLGPVASAMKCPSLGHLRDIVKLNRQAIDDLNLLDRRLAVSEAVRGFHIAQGLDGQHTMKLYNGVDLERFRPRHRTGFLHREFQLPESARLIGTVGQIALRKGHDVMARAMQRIAVIDEQAHWLIVGDRYSDKVESRLFEASLHELAASGPCAGRIHFLSYRSDMPAIYAELALLVHPARQEPLGRVLLEAGACGVPIVATNVGGTCEIYPPETNAACLVAPDDADGLAAAVIAVLNDEPLAVKIGTAARARIESNFDRSKTAEGLIRHYHDLLQQ